MHNLGLSAQELELLKEGYMARAAEDRELAEEFLPLDIEAWDKMEEATDEDTKAA